MRVFLLTVLVISSSFFVCFGQNRMSSENGDWHQPSTWGGETVPDNTNGTFGWVVVNHTVTVRANTYNSTTPLRIDHLIIEAAGTLVIETGAAILIENGSGDDLTIRSGGVFTVNGSLLLNSGVAFAGANTSNTSFTSTADLRTSTLTLPSASGYDLITVTLEGITSGVTLNSTWNQLTSTTDLVISCGSLGNNAINFAGTITSLNSLQINDTDGITGGRVIINSAGTSALNIGSGGLSVTGESRLFLTNGGNVTVNLDGDFSFSPDVSALFSQSARSGIGTINFNNGDLLMTSGLWRMASVDAGNGYFTFNNASGMHVSGGVISEEGSGAAQGTIEFVGNSGDQSLNIITSAFGTGTLTLVINKTAGNVLLENSAAVPVLSLVDGTLQNNAISNILTVRGSIDVTSGTIDSNIPMSFVLSGTGALPAILTFEPGSVFQNLTLNRAGASLSVSNVSIADQGSVTMMAGSLATSIPALGVYDLIYDNTEAVTTGPEMPTSESELKNLTVQGNGAVNLGGNVTINGDLILQSGAGGFEAGDFNVAVTGDFLANRDFEMNSTTVFTFLTRSPSNSHSITGSGTILAIGGLVVSGDLTIEKSLTLYGDLTIQSSSSLVANAGTLTFAGTTSISNSGTNLSFNAVSIAGTMTAPLNGVLSVASDFSGSGTFVHNGSTLIFNGNGSSSIADKSRTFNNIAVTAGKTLTTALSHTVKGNIENDGVINFTAGTLTIGGTNSLLSGNGNTTFATLAISTDAAFTANKPFALTGDFGGHGNFSSTSTVTFAGVTTIGGGGSKLFNNIIVDGTSLTPNSSYTISGDLTVSSGSLHSTNNTTTFGGTSTVSGAGSIAFNSIVINNTLTFPSRVITLTGSFTNHGTFNHGSGTISFGTTGTTKYLQGSAAITLNNLTIGNNGSATDVTNINTAGVSVVGLVSVDPLAVLDADGTGNGLFTLVSTESADGSIGPLLEGASVVGNVTVERLISAIDDTHRFFSTPVRDARVSHLQDDVAITGDFSGTSFPCTGCNNNGPSLRWFNESLGGTFSERYAPTPVAGGSNTEALISGRGYDLYMWNGVSSTLIDLTGPMNQGEFIFQNLTHTPSSPSDPSTDGWHLLGNPYPSAIAWDDGAGWVRDNIDPTVWVWDEGGGIWRSYHYVNGGNLPGGIIASGQGFWVSALAGGGSMSVNENAKSLTAGTYYRMRSSQPQGLIIALSQGDVTDNAYVLLSKKGTPGFDLGLDSYKLQLGIERMSLSVGCMDEKRLAYMVVNPNDVLEEIPIYIAVKESGHYELNFESIGRDSNLMNYTLFDRYLNEYAPLSTGYEFTTAKNTETYYNRFVLLRSIPQNSFEHDLVVDYYPNPVNHKFYIDVKSRRVTEVSLLNSFGQPVSYIDIAREREKTIHVETDLTNFPSGVYFLKVVLDNRTTYMKKIVKN